MCRERSTRRCWLVLGSCVSGGHHHLLVDCSLSPPCSPPEGTQPSDQGLKSRTFYLCLRNQARAPDREVNPKCSFQSPRAQTSPPPRRCWVSHLGPPNQAQGAYPPENNSEGWLEGLRASATKMGHHGGKKLVKKRRNLFLEPGLGDDWERAYPEGATEISLFLPQHLMGHPLPSPWQQPK